MQKFEGSAKSAKFDWEQHRYKGVLCEFRPRESYKGRLMKPGLAEKAGLRLRLVKMWTMNKDDPYPGEVALSTEGSIEELYKTLGLSWIASGDVKVIEE